MKAKFVLLGILVFMSAVTMARAERLSISLVLNPTINQSVINNYNNITSGLSANGWYLYNDSTSIYLNATRLNMTIDSRMIGGSEPFYTGNITAVGSCGSDQKLYLNGGNLACAGDMTNGGGWNSCDDISVCGYLTSEINWNANYSGYNKADWDSAYQYVTNNSFYPKSNPYGFYNSSNFLIADYYLKSNPYGYYNSTTLPSLYPYNNPYNFYNSTTIPAYLLSVSGLTSSNITGYNNLNWDTSFTYATNGTFYPAANPYNYYNSTTIPAYYLQNNPYSYYNATTIPAYLLTVSGLGDSNITSINCGKITGNVSDLCSITPGSGSGANFWAVSGSWMHPNTTAGGQSNINVTSINSSNWLNVTITKSQVSDFGSPLYSYTETDPFNPAKNSSVYAWSCDYTPAAAVTMCPGWTGAAIATGTNVANTTDPEKNNHPGIVTFRSSTTTDSGYQFSTEVTQFLIAGGENLQFIFKALDASALNNTWIRMGFQDSVAIGLPADGAYLNITGMGSTKTLGGVCRSNSAQTGTSSTYTISTNTWYHGTVIVNASATNVTFRLQNAAGSILWEDYCVTNIPTGAGRYTGHGVACFLGGITARDVMSMDYMNIYINRQLVR